MKLSEENKFYMLYIEQLSEQIRKLENLRHGKENQAEETEEA